MVCKNCANTNTASKPASSNKLLTGTKYSVRKCKLCPSSTIQDPKANYCQSCSYKHGICSICGTKTLDTSLHRQRDF